jgi:hypothetical protein
MSGGTMSTMLEGKNAIIDRGAGGIGAGGSFNLIGPVLNRAPRLAAVVEVAKVLASDRSSGMTGTMTNVTSGLVLR